MGYILFSSENDIYIQAYQSWDGIIEYSYNNKDWKEWNGNVIINNKIYMRGVNNTTITNGKSPWAVTGKEVKFQGNIENLLDYKSVINNIHPKMAEACFAWMFMQAEVFIELPQLLALELSNNCYFGMFFSNTHVTDTTLFPNLLIAKEAVINQQMFGNCPIQTININNKLYDINVLKLL